LTFGLERRTRLLLYSTTRHDGGLQFFASGEYKDVDRFRSKKAEETGLTSVFLGPRMIVSRGRFSEEVAAEIRLSRQHGIASRA
jgi:hypothetical protein